jgi:hypothetical protein
LAVRCVLSSRVLDYAEVGQGELEFDDLAVAHGIDAAHYVRDVGILEAANHVHDRVGLTDVREELVAKALTLGGALHQAGDVHELDDGRNGLLGLHDLGELGEARVGNFDHADVRLDGAEWIIRGFRTGGRERIEQCGLADVRQPDDSQFEHSFPCHPALRSG